MLVDTRVGRLFVEVSGEGAPLLLWHSLLCDGSMWRFQLPELAERYRVINVDGPGHGRSASVRKRFTLEDCADAAREILDALDVKRTHWAGLSWGGMTGMRFALRYPDRIDRLALIDTSANRESRRKIPSYKVMAAIAKRFGAIGILRQRIAPIFFTRESLHRRPELVADFSERLARMDPASVGHCVDAVIFDRIDIRPQLAAITAPTLVIVGEQDIATPPDRARDIARAIDGARLVQVPGAAHLSALEQPERITRELLEFFG